MYKTLIRPVLNHLDSETWHGVAREMMHFAEMTPLTLRTLERLSCGGSRFKDPRLAVNPGGVELDNPLLVGAGWDKSGRAVKALWTIGFSGVEVGSVLEYGQPGNPKPRQFMLNSGVCLNWLGFNSPGMETVSRNLDRYRSSGIPVGISIGINKFVMPKHSPLAHAAVAEYLYDYASYFVINVSSPNTEGLRELQNKSRLNDIVQAVNHIINEHETAKPLFVKIAPELTETAVDDVIDVVLDNGIAGIIATNTTINPEIKSKYGMKWKDTPGGLSGDDDDFRELANKKIAHIYKEAGDRLDIIGVGGVKDSKTAIDKIRAGAKALQVVTGLRGEGLYLPTAINRGIVDFMEKEGIKNIPELVGTAVNK